MVVGLRPRRKLGRASFNGKNNYSKARLLIYMVLVECSDNPRYLSNAEICAAIPDFKKSYLPCRGPLLCKWQYLERVKMPISTTQAIFVYSVNLEHAGKLFKHTPEIKFITWLNEIVNRNPELIEPAKRLIDVVGPHLKKIAW